MKTRYFCRCFRRGAGPYFKQWPRCPGCAQQICQGYSDPLDLASGVHVSCNNINSFLNSFIYFVVWNRIVPISMSWGDEMAAALIYVHNNYALCARTLAATNHNPILPAIVFSAATPNIVLDISVRARKTRRLYLAPSHPDNTPSNSSGGRALSSHNFSTVFYGPSHSFSIEYTF